MTGGGSGIGAGVCVRLAEEGCKVVVVDAVPGRAEDVAGGLGESLAVTADVSTEEGVAAYTAAAVDRFGRIDLYHLNAGIGGTLAPYPDIEIDEFDAVMNVNVRGAFLGLRAAFRQFERQEGGGAIVLTASIASDRGSSDLVPYTVSKAAVASLARTRRSTAGRAACASTRSLPASSPRTCSSRPRAPTRAAAATPCSAPATRPRARRAPRRGRGARRVPAQRRCVVHGRRHRAGRRRRSSDEPGPPQRRRQPIANPRGRPLHTFPRPDQTHLSVERTPVEATCPECGATDIAEYRVLAEGGWWEVRKCQACLHSLSREPGPLLGSYVPLGLRIMEKRLMLGVDAGGTFTDVVSVRDGRIEVTKVPSSRTDPAAPVVEGARRLGVEGQTVFNHASTMGLNAVITRRLPKVAFLTTEGHRDMLAAGRVWRPLDGQTDASLAPVVRRRGPSARPALPAARDRRAPARRRLRARRARRGPGPRAARGAEALRHRGRRDLPHQRLRQPAARAAPARRWPRRCSGTSRSRSPRRSRRWRRSTPRASTTVVDVLMKLMYGGYADQLDRELTESGFTGELNFADCAATLMPWRGGAEAPLRDRVRGPGGGDGLLPRTSARRWGTANLMCCDVGGTSTDVVARRRGPPVRGEHVRARARPRSSTRSRPRSPAWAPAAGRSSRSRPPGTSHVGPASAGAEPGTGLLRLRRRAADGDRRGAAHGHPRPGRLRVRRGAAWTPTARGRRSRRWTSPLSVEQRIAFAYRIAVNNIAEEVVEHRDPPRRGSA